MKHAKQSDNSGVIEDVDQRSGAPHSTCPLGPWLAPGSSSSNDRIYPAARVFYADPFVDMHNRMKEALVLLGRLPRAVVRPPLVKIREPEIARIREALVAAGLLDETGKRREAA